MQDVWIAAQAPSISRYTTDKCNIVFAPGNQSRLLIIYHHVMTKYSGGIRVKNSPESTAVRNPVIIVARTTFGSSSSSKTTQTVDDTMAHRIRSLDSDPLQSGLSDTELMMTGMSSV
jgi:hypothetical protein